MRTHILFDLDGTLTDSAPGITRCLEHAVWAVGGSPPEPSSLRSLIGSPMQEILGVLLPGADPNTIDEATSAYAARFDQIGIFENSVFPGITDALESLQEEGCQLYVATAKGQDVANRVIEEFHLTPWFRSVFGRRAGQGIHTKEDVIRCCLSEFGIPSSDAAMVGDRSHDIEAARALEVRAVGVAWGYGSQVELARAHAIAAEPATLVDTLRRTA